MIGISMFLDELLQFASLRNIRVRSGPLASSGLGGTTLGSGYGGTIESVLDKSSGLVVHGSGELDLKNDHKAAMLVDALVEGHAQVFNGEFGVWLDHFPWSVLYPDLSAIEVRKDEVETSQSLEQGDFLLHEKVSTFALEGLVLLFLKDHDNITSFGLRNLISFSVLGVLLTIGCTLVDLNHNSLLLLLNLLACAGLAHLGGVNGLALTAAIVAATSLLRVHTRSQLHHYGPHATALACLAGLDSLGV